MFAFNEHGVVKDIVNEVPKDIHPDLEKLYKEVPPEMVKKVKVGWRINDDEFIPPAPTGFDGNREALIEWVKTERNNKLFQTDKYLIPDYPITDDQRKAVKAYRQKLRDFPGTIPESARDVGDITFPKNPLD